MRSLPRCAKASFDELNSIKLTHLLENSLNKDEAWSVLERSWGVSALAVQFTQASLWSGQSVVVRLALVVAQASLSAVKQVICGGAVETMAWEGVVELLQTAERVARLLGRKRQQDNQQQEWLCSDGRHFSQLAIPISSVSVGASHGTFLWLELCFEALVPKGMVQSKLKTIHILPTILVHNKQCCPCYSKWTF